MADADSGTQVEEKPTKPRRALWARFVHRIIRQARKRKAEKQPEAASDKAARRTAAATIAIAALTLVMVGVNYFQWREIHAGGTDTHDLAIAAGQQAVATKAIADLTAKQIESQRAAIDVGFKSVVAPITFHDNSISANFSILIVNDGALPARNVRVRYKPSPIQWGNDIFSAPRKRQEELCNSGPTQSVAEKQFTDPITIFSGRSVEQQLNFGMSFASSDLVELPNDPHKTQRVFPIVVGCVDYQSGSFPQQHQTPFIFEIHRKSIYKGEDLPTLLYVGRDVPIQDIWIIQYRFGQGKSY